MSSVHVQTEILLVRTYTIQFPYVHFKPASSITRGVLDKVGEGVAGLRADIRGRGVCGECVLEGFRSFSDVLKCFGSFSGRRSGA